MIIIRMSIDPIDNKLVTNPKLTFNYAEAKPSNYQESLEQEDGSNINDIDEVNNVIMSVDLKNMIKQDKYYNQDATITG